MRAAIIAIGFSLAVLQAYAQDNAAAVSNAGEAAGTWIDQIDAEAYAETYDDAAPIVHASVTQEQWVGAMQQVRGQVGELQERELQNSQYTTSLPNAPEGEYVIFQYLSAFQQVPKAMEVIVMMRTDEGAWKAAGYQVMPAPEVQGQAQQGQTQQAPAQQAPPESEEPQSEEPQSEGAEEPAP